MIEKHFGVLTSLDWNSNKWQALPTDEDIKQASFENIHESGITFSSLNFAQDAYPVDEKGYYYGLIPHMWAKMPDKEKALHVEVIFIKSFNWNDNQSYLIGIYAFPVFRKFKKESPIPEITREFEVNIKALPKNIHLLDTPINLTLHTELSKLLPSGKTIGKLGYNYLTKPNVYKILDTMTHINPDDAKLSSIKYRLITSINRKH